MLHGCTNNVFNDKFIIGSLSPCLKEQRSWSCGGERDTVCAILRYYVLLICAGHDITHL
jgi:hypothetical protein